MNFKWWEPTTKKAGRLLQSQVMIAAIEDYPKGGCLMEENSDNHNALQIRGVS